MVGCVVERVAEIFSVMDSDIPKDSNMECTCISLALDHTARILKHRNVQMPPHCSIKYDNTGREGKNQTVAKYQAWQVARENFRSCQDGNGEKGHTHDSLDQRFSVAATAVVDTVRIEDPDALVEVFKYSIAPCRGRELIVKRLHGTYDWASYFDQLAINVGGIAASKYTPYVCHS